MDDYSSILDFAALTSNLMRVVRKHETHVDVQQVRTRAINMLQSDSGLRPEEALFESIREWIFDPPGAATSASIDEYVAALTADYKLIFNKTHLEMMADGEAEFQRRVAASRKIEQEKLGLSDKEYEEYSQNIRKESDEFFRFFGEKP